MLSPKRERPRKKKVAPCCQYRPSRNWSSLGLWSACSTRKVSGITLQTQAVILGSKPLFTLLANKPGTPGEHRLTHSCAPNHDPGIMEDFIERTLRERRS